MVLVLAFSSPGATGGGGEALGLGYSAFINVGYVNLNSLVNKISSVEFTLSSKCIDVLGVGETWLTQEVTDPFIAINNYKIVRKDNPSRVRKHGVAVYVRNGLKYEEIACDLKNVVVIRLSDQDVHIVTIYRPPSYDAEDNTQLINFLFTFCRNKEVVLLGDFNLPTLRWEQEDPAEAYILPTDQMFLDLFTDLGLWQAVREPTNFPSCSIIDLCLLSHPERLGTLSVEPPLPSCSHGVVLMSYTFQEPIPPSRAVTKRIWNKGNYQQIRLRLEEYDWDLEFAGLGTQEMYNRFLTIINHLVDRFVPTEGQRDNKPPWTLNPPRQLRREKSYLFDRYKAVRSSLGRRHQTTLDAWREFSDANMAIKNFARKSQEEYERKVASQLKTNPKRFHAYLRHRRVGRPTVGPLKVDDGTITDDPLAMSEHFARSFAGVFESDLPPRPAANQTANTILEEIVVSAADVEREIKTLDMNTSMGADGIHPRLLVMCGSCVSYPLSLIYNSSLREGVLPLEWLSSKISPIYKKGPRTDSLNYRPVAITSVPCKVLEKIIVRHLKQYLEENSLLSEHQYGFRSKHSTIDQLILTYDDVTRDVDEGRMVDIIFFDFSKAFDKVRHGILLNKLSDLGICDQLVRWIERFLVDRRMHVAIHGVESRGYRVTSGVPQGSVLGPVLFLIYVNHVVHRLTSPYKIFADDIKLYICSMPRNPSTGIAELQADIDTLVATSSSWGLEMNASKCACLRLGPRSLGECTRGVSPYKVGAENIPFSAAHSDLGVKVDRKLKFHDHIRATAGACNALATNIFSSTICRDPDFVLTTYKTLVRPKLEYGSTIWNLGYLGDLRSLERVQKRWTREIRGLESLPYSERLRCLDLFSIQGRLLRADMILVWKIFSGDCAIAPEQIFVLNRSSRRGHDRKLFLPRSNLEIRKRFFSVRVVKQWNALSAETVAAPSLSSFKKLLHRDLAQKLFDYTE